MSRSIHKSHNVSVLLYHAVCAANYRRTVFTPEVDAVLKAVCLEIAERYETVLLEIGRDKNHVHFLLQSVPTYSPTKIGKPSKASRPVKSFGKFQLSKSSCGVARSGQVAISSTR